ncbi:MAG: hypothetical protein HRT89_09395 [Lentisphaeria bacterium]|nr:hypothetical protein [Lentisphaeria bacterium]NQZ68274.1 hypothetical protein [Lentisphaeria bacterium]
MKNETVQEWIKSARARGSVSSENLDELERLNNSSLRQALLYLHASGPNIQLPVIGSALHPAKIDYTSGGIDPGSSCPYQTVHEAMLDGWKVIHFPQQNAPFEDREIDLIGFEFILEKMVPINE